MGEIIKRETSEVELPFNGERFTGEVTGQTEIEHLHRALMARSLCRGKDVLDIASGEGYCSALIAQVARSVVGVDIDAKAVEYATTRYLRNNLRFVCGTAQNIPLDDASVDVVVSFETIEHFSDHKRFLEDIRRVLRPGGLVIISTPDLAIYSVDGEAANPYHVQEMTREEFSALLSGFFKHVVYLGQRTMVGSALIADTVLSSESYKAPFLTYEARGSNAFERSVGLSRARYIVALASDERTALAEVEQSAFIATSEIDKAVGLHDNLRRDLVAARAQIAENNASEVRWRSDIETVTGWFEKARQEAEGLRERLEQLRREAEEKDAVALQLSTALEATVGHHEEQIEYFVAELVRVRDDRLEISARLAAEVEHARAGHQALVAQHLGEVEQGVRERQDLVNQLFAEVSQRHDLMARFSAEVADLSRRLEAEVENHRAVAAELRRLEAELENHRAVAAELRRQGHLQEDVISETLALLNHTRSELVEARTIQNDRATNASLLDRLLVGAGTDVEIFKRIVGKARLAARESDHGRAEGLFRMAVDGQPTDSEAWRGYAEALHCQGAYLAALGAWERALLLDAQDVLALAGSGRTLAEIDRHEEALAQWKAALSIDPGQREIVDHLEAAGVTSAQMVDLVLASPTIGTVVSEVRTRVYVKTLLTRLKAYSALRRGRPREAARLFRLLADRSLRLADLIRYSDVIAGLVGLGRARDLYFRAYKMAADDARVRRRMADVRSQDFGLRLHPKVDLRLCSDGSYSTLSQDPQFELDMDGRPMPTGWTLISISGDAREGAIRPVVYAFHGERGREVKAFTFPPMTGTSTVSCLLPLPKDITRLRLDPTCKSHVTFRLDRVGWLPGEALEGAVFTPLANTLAFVGEEPPSHGRDLPSLVPLSLRAQHDLKPLESGGFEAIGNDPQFEIVGGESLGGWTWLTLQCDELDAPLDPMLYAFSEGEVVTVLLPELSGGASSLILVRLPDRVSHLRFDPTTRVGARFSLPVLHSCRAGLVDQVLGPCAFPPQTPDAHFVARELTCRVRPEHQLEALDHGRYRSDGDDPQFLLSADEQGLPGGLVRIAVRIDHLNQPLDATLYAFPDADLPPYSYALRELSSGRTREFDLVLPQKIRALRFDPCDRPGVVFGLPYITLTQISPGYDLIYELAPGQRWHDKEHVLATIGILRPQHHLEGNATEFRTTGDDPQFGISFDGKPFPSGWTVITLKMAAADTILKPVLYCWTGTTVSQVSLADVGTDLVSRQLVHFQPDLTALRLDCTDLPGICFSKPELSFAPAEMFAGHLLIQRASVVSAPDYGEWCETYDRLTAQDRMLIAESIERLVERPLISVVMPVYDPEPRFLRRALDTVIDQLYPDWELCIAEDCSPNPEIRQILQAYADRDPRIKLIFRTENGHISRASNSALELVRGSFVALMDHDDELPAHALYMVAYELNRFPETDILYSDEDKIDANGRRHDPHFKTDWNRELFYSQNMVAHLGVYRTSLVREVGGFRVGFEGSQDYDLTLRILRRTSAERIRHIPHVLYHWRIFEGVRTFSSNNPDRSVATAQRAMLDYFNEVEPTSLVMPIEAFPSWWRIKRPVPEIAPSVTIVIPTRDRIELLRNCVDGVLGRTDYPNLDIVIVDNGSVEPESLDYLAGIATDPRVTMLRDTGPFNYSRLNNAAVALARGDYVCFLNNDIETIAPDWLSELVAQAVRPGVGAVGTRLLYASGRIQHAGVTIGVYGVAAHGHRHFPGDSIGYFGHPQLVREVSAVTAAALLMPKALFQSLGGFDERNLAVSYNDVDLCLRLREAGYTIVYTPFAALYHLESASRGADVTQEKKALQRIERGYMRTRWGKMLDYDPYYNPNLSLETEDYHIAFPPRALRPWIEEADVPERLARTARAALPDVADTDLVALARDTTIVIACQAPFDLLATLAADMRATNTFTPEIVLVDNGARTEAFVRAGAVAAFAKTLDNVKLRVIDDPMQDFSASRTANLGFAATDDTFGHVLIITEDCSLTSGWLNAILRSWLAAGDSDAVLSPLLFVRENTTHHGVMTDGYVELPVTQIAAAPSAVLAMSEGYEGLPQPGRKATTQIGSDRVPLELNALPSSGILMARRSVLTAVEVDGGGALFDPLLYTVAARLEDFALRAQARRAHMLTALAPVAVLAHPRPRDHAHLWQYWHDYLWVNRKVHGMPDDGVIEFVCPFHRGDVLVGLQVAYTAHLAGHQIRFHVAESLLEWVDAFEPPFAVRGLPVPVPPANETAFYLLRSYEHLMRQPNAGPRIARSHPVRGLDAMGNNLATAMLVAVGLPADTPIEALVPTIKPEQMVEADMLLGPYGDRIVLLHRSGGWAMKSLPEDVLDRFARIVAAKGFRLVQIGGPADEKWSQADGMVRGNFQLGVWAALFRRANAVAGIDSWTSHMAALLDVPQITFFGSTHPDHVASKPYFRKQAAPALLIPPTVACSPCNSLICLYQPEPFCLGYSIDPVAISAFLDRLEA